MSLISFYAIEEIGGKGVEPNPTIKKFVLKENDVTVASFATEMEAASYINSNLKDGIYTIVKLYVKHKDRVEQPS